MAQLNPYGVAKRLFDFSSGMWTVRPKELIPDNASPYLKNVLYDEKYRLTKIWGTSSLLIEANNAFATNPIYNLYNFVNLDGEEILIIQGVASGVMKLWYLKPGDSSVTEIATALATKRRCSFATHMGRLYMWNGVDTLRYWNGSTWAYYHTDEAERFRYLATHNYRLWAASSGKNPSRVIYTAVSGHVFNDYFTYDPPTLNFMDFTTSDGMPIMHICEFQDSLLVFKVNHIFRIFGDPSYATNIKCVSDGIGTVAGGSVQVFNNLVYFTWKDGLYVYGDTGVAASPEDRMLQTVPNVVRISSEIDDYWKTNFTLNDPSQIKEKVWAGATDFATCTLTGCQANTAPITTNPVVVNYTLSGSAQDEEEQTTYAEGWIDFTDSTMRDYYYGQTLKLDYTTDADMAICTKVSLYLKKTGTMTSSHKLKAYIVGVKTVDGVDVPDFDDLYAEGQLVGTSVTSGTGDWYDITMSYWKYPQNCYDGDYTTPPTICIAIKTAGMSGSAYISWGYALDTAYTDGRMVNSDLTDIGGHPQSALDYAFKFYANNFDSTATVETGTYDSGANSGIDHWGNVYAAIDENTFDGYTRNSKLEKIEYEVKTADSGWGSWTETTNGGGIEGNGRYLRLKLTFKRTDNVNYHQDSFTLISLRVTFSIQAMVQQLMASAIWKNRYIGSLYEIIDNPDNSDMCLDFDGVNDEVRVAHNDDLMPETGNFAVELWFKAAPSASQGSIYPPLIACNCSTASQVYDGSWGIEIDDYNVPADVGKIRIILAVNPHSGQYITTDVGTWKLSENGNPHHLIMNVDRTAKTAQVYIDGVSIGTVDITVIGTGSITNSSCVFLGAVAIDTADIPTMWLNGKIKQARFYKGTTLSADHIAYDYANPTKCYSTTYLKLWLTCNEGTGTTTFDASGNGHDGSLGNGVVNNMPEWSAWTGAPT